ncbi:DUF6083 domain-containing protein [Actinacidiphila bryophytorum]|uniref:DUF6083 domain-containing protein n=1 Tax=Actinacidiphila bryophytorum TaxID=1436133 RepID=UPI00396A1DAF
MRHTHSPDPRRWDGSPAVSHRVRALAVHPAAPSRLLRCGQRSRCVCCAHVLERYDRIEQPPIDLHPRELPSHDVPDSLHWHITAGVALAQPSGAPRCRVTHSLVCPARGEHPLLTPALHELRRQLAVRTRCLIDSGVFTPTTTPTGDARTGCSLPRPVVQILHRRYLAPSPVSDLRCVAQTRARRRCRARVAAPAWPGLWTLLPIVDTSHRRSADRRVMAVYDLGALPYTEQVRWRNQRCPDHLGSAAPDLLPAQWEPFDVRFHHPHIATRLPTEASRAPAAASYRSAHPSSGAPTC